ncbi:MAG: Stp1/IreP family PP2C-type Ser/Thr phosphatase [Bacteroidia bacterium]|nr:Stp1/IreP family PP2C-type Ser/Thr phosphatase [Bacteroidia bacterium]MDW8134720.1 Stp1/IreP family PP2C-type Ser/Thr phosphatase [Bacteroidia bacterium]
MGRVRPNNEDRVAYVRTQHGSLWMVCDGMGGHAAGEKAAELAIQAVVEFFSHTTEPLTPSLLLEKALHEANEAIYKIAQLHPEYRRMGTTCVMALYQSGYLHYAHVGDSRLYLYRQGQLYQKTLDHSYVQFLVSQGLLTPEEAELHPRRHVILRALGLSSRPEPEVASTPIEVQRGDLVLLCSDGLNNMLHDAEIAAILAKSSPVSAKAQELILAANEAGGVDNISVALVEFY